MPNKHFFASRSAPVRETPQSVNTENRSVDFVAATEKPCQVMDWERFEVVNEVLRMDGVELPPSGRVPFLDSHARESVAEVLGSFGNFSQEMGGQEAGQKGEKGAELHGSAFFSTVREGEDAFIKVREGHVTDVSVGYEILEHVWIPKERSMDVGGRTYSGPLRVVTRWRLKEVSLCPMGADSSAKARKQRSKKMPDKNKGQRADICEFLLEGECTLTGGAECKWLTEFGCSKSVAATAEAEAGADAKGSGTTENTPPALPEGSAATGAEDEGRSAVAMAARAERQRIHSLRSLCRTFGISSQEEEGFVQRGASLEQARSTVLDTLATRSHGATAQGAGFARAEVGRSERSKVLSAAGHGLMLRCHVQLEKPAPGAQEYRSMTMREMARDLLQRAGISVPTDVKTLMGRALTSTDLPLLLTDTSSRLLLDAWEGAETTWNLWCDVGDANDFKTNKAVDFGLDQTLPEVPEHGEYSYGYASENGEPYQLATYGKIFPLTRHALINDNLSALTRMATAHGEAAARTINRLVYSVLNKNAAMSDGKPLFHADHRNLAAGSGGLPDVAKIGKAVKLMRNKRDVAGNPISVRPAFFLAPTDLETAAETFFSSALIGTQAEPNRANIYGGSYFTRVYDPELDKHSPTDWYLSGPQGRGVTVFFLSGASAPRLEEKQGWSVDGVEWKVSIDAAAAALSHLGLAKAAV